MHEASGRNARVHEASETEQSPFAERKLLGAEQDVEANTTGQQEARNGKDRRPPTVLPEGVWRA